jgi:hypothetical protein
MELAAAMTMALYIAVRIRNLHDVERKGVTGFGPASTFL